MRGVGFRDQDAVALMTMEARGVLETWLGQDFYDAAVEVRGETDFDGVTVSVSILGGTPITTKIPYTTLQGDLEGALEDFVSRIEPEIEAFRRWNDGRQG